MKYINIVAFLILSIHINGQSVQGTLLGTWSDESLVASAAHDNTYNEIWGFVANDHEFAVLGTTLGTHFIDVTDPTNPEELFVVEGGTVGPGIIHRDFHDYQGYLYSIADEGSNTGLQIIDISNLPESIEVVYDSREYFTRSHNIFIDEAKARLYSLISNGTSFGFAPMRIFDISNPIDPQPIGTYNTFDGYQISQVHDAYVRNDTAYLNLGPRGFAIVDFDNVDTPNVISVITSSEYPQAGYNHSGWLTEDGNYYYMADEDFGHDMKVLDLTNLPDIDIPTVFNAGSENPATIPHNQIVHGDKLYVSYYYDGLQVYDISDPVNPVREMHYPTSTLTATNGLYRGAWGVYPFLPSGNILVSDMQNGLFVIDGQLPTSTEDAVVATDQFSIYPNPSNGDFEVDLSSLEGTDFNLEIIDNNGKTVSTREINKVTNTISLNGKVSPGLYSIKIANESKSITKRLLISK